MQQKWKITFLIPVLLGLYCMAFSQSTIQFKMMFNNQFFHQDSSYSNQSGETLQIQRFMFYTSKWKLITATNDTIPLSNNHFLINLSEEQSTKLPFTILSNAKKLILILG